MGKGRPIEKNKAFESERWPKQVNPKQMAQPFSAKPLFYLAEGVGFEPTVPCGTTDFESVTFDLSDTPPGVRLLGAGDWGLAKAQPP